MYNIIVLPATQGTHTILLVSLPPLCPPRGPGNHPVIFVDVVYNTMIANSLKVICERINCCHLKLIAFINYLTYWVVHLVSPSISSSSVHALIHPYPMASWKYWENNVRRKHLITYHTHSFTHLSPGAPNQITTTYVNWLFLLLYNWLISPFRASFPP